MEENISINKYIDITSLSAGGSLANKREPIARLFTESELVPIGNTLVFTNPDEVLSYFGVESVEYNFAYKYFNWISDRGRKAKRISFDRISQNAIAPTVISGINIGNSLSSLKKQSLKLELSLGEKTISIDADTSSASSLADVAGILSEQLGESNGTITLNTSLNGSRFVLQAASASDLQWQIEANEDAALMGWTNSTFVINSYAIGTESISSQVADILRRNDNCYTFGFLFSIDKDDVEAVAKWNHSQNQKFVFCYGADKTVLQDTIQPLVSNYEGIWLQVDIPGEYQIWQPMAITANLDYSKEHAAVSYMYKQFPTDTPTVFDDSVKDALDGANINYLGRTQQAGKNISFLQEGWLQGATKDMTVFVNAIWLKDSLIVELLSLFLRKGAVYANAADMAIMAGVCVDIFSQAISNGVILTGATLTSDERAAVEQYTGDEKAYAVIESQGYIFTYSVSTLDNGKKAFSFQLIYKACDTIRKVEGVNIAITSTAQ